MSVLEDCVCQIMLMTSDYLHDMKTFCIVLKLVIVKKNLRWYIYIYRHIIWSNGCHCTKTSNLLQTDYIMQFVCVCVCPKELEVLCVKKNHC